MLELEDLHNFNLCHEKNAVITRRCRAVRSRCRAAAFSDQQTAALSENPRGSRGDGWHFQTCYLPKLLLHIQFRGHSFNIRQAALQEFTGIFKCCWVKSKGCVYMHRMKPGLTFKAHPLVLSQFDVSITYYLQSSFLPGAKKTNILEASKKCCHCSKKSTFVLHVSRWLYC